MDYSGIPVVAQCLTNVTRDYEVEGSIPALAQWVDDPGIDMSCGVGGRRGSNPALLWLWRRPGATAPIRPLAWEPPYATDAALKSKKTKNKNKKTPKNLESYLILSL